MKRKAEATGFEDMFAVNIDEKAEKEEAAPDIESVQDTSESITTISESIDQLDNKSVIKKAAAKNIPQDLLVEVRSLVFGELIYKSKSNNTIMSWQDIGETKEMTFEQIIDMNNTNTDYLRKPYVVLLNADVANYFGLEKIYSNLASVWNIQKLFNMPIHALEKTLDVAMSVNLRDVIIAQVRKLYDNHALTDIRVIKALENKLHIDIMDD